MSGTYLNQKLPFTSVYSLLQKKAYAWVFFFTKVAGPQPKKSSTRDIFQWVYLIFQKNLGGDCFCEHSFFLLCRPHLQNVIHDLGYVLIIFKYFQSKYCESHCTKKLSFPLRISSMNVTKSAENCGFGHIYWRNS